MKNSSGSEMTTAVGGGRLAKLERKTVEKNRRLHMKGLCFKLSSLIPRDYSTGDSASKDTVVQQDNIEAAASYIKNLQERIERLRKSRELSKSIEGSGNNHSNSVGFKMPVIEVRQGESNLEVILISRQEKAFIYHEVVRILAEEGAEIVNASSSVVGDKVIHTIHSQPILSRTGIDVSTISERLNELVQ